MARDPWLPRQAIWRQLPPRHQLAADIETVVSRKAAYSETQAVLGWRPFICQTALSAFSGFCPGLNLGRSSSR